MEINVGKGLTITVDRNKLGLPENPSIGNGAVADHVVYIGLRNILMDAHAGVSTDEPDYQAKARAIVEKKLAALYAGEVRVAGTREGDPVKAEAMRLATDAVKAMLRKAGKKVSSYDAKALRDAAKQYLDRTPELVETARARVEQAKSIGGDADLADLGL